MRLIDFDKLMEMYDFYNEFAVHDLRYLKKEYLPFVDAIPVEWARAYMNELNKQAEKEWEYVLNELGGNEPCYCEMYARGIKHLLNGWEEENEQSNN